MSESTTDPDKPPWSDAIAVLVGQAAEAFTDGWLLMLAIGMAHSYHHSIPTFGYWPCVFFGWVLAGLAATGVAPTRRILEGRLKRMGRRIS